MGKRALVCRKELLPRDMLCWREAVSLAQHFLRPSEGDMLTWCRCSRTSRRLMSQGRMAARALGATPGKLQKQAWAQCQIPEMWFTTTPWYGSTLTSVLVVHTFF